MRVLIDNFNLAPAEIEKLWTKQNKYIDQLESTVWENEKRVKLETSRREQVLTRQVIRKKYELKKIKAEITELRDFQASQGEGVAEYTRVLCSECSGLRNELVCQVPSCSRRSNRVKLRYLPTNWYDLNSESKDIIRKELQLPENITRVCRSCFTRMKRKISVILGIQNFNKECDQQKKRRNTNKKIKKSSSALFSSQGRLQCIRV